MRIAIVPGLDGLELAGRLRERDGDAGIVILSNYEKYALPAYKVRPYDYIMKTRCEAELPGALEGIWRERQRKARENIYLLKNNEMMKAIRLDRILYLEKEKKKKYTVIHCSGGEDYNEKLPLEKAYEKLPKDSFLYINRGHIINMEHITCLEKEEITLADSVWLPLSRYRMTAVKDELDTVFQGFYDSNHFLDIMDGSLAISMQICRCILSGIYIMDDGSFGGSFNNHSIELYCITLKFTVLHWLNAYGWRYAVGLLGME